MNRTILFSSVLASQFVLAESLPGNQVEQGINRNTSAVESQQNLNTSPLHSLDKNLMAKASNGDANAQLAVASILMDKAQTKEQVEEALNWCKKASDQGLPEAQLQLATLYIQSNNDTFKDQGIKLLETASNKGFAPAEGVLGQYYLSEKQFKKGFELLQSASNKNDVSSTMLLAQIYASGLEGVTEKNSKKAIELVTPLAKKNMVEAQTFAAVLMLEQNQDIETALKYLTNAAENRFPFAEFVLGKMIIDGLFGKDKDYMDSALSLLQDAGHQGFAPAYLLLAQIYKDGLAGQAKNLEKAQNYAKKAKELS